MPDNLGSKRHNTVELSYSLRAGLARIFQKEKEGEAYPSNGGECAKVNHTANQEQTEQEDPFEVLENILKTDKEPTSLYFLGC
jgi:hypothetical protein